MKLYQYKYLGFAWALVVMIAVSCNKSGDTPASPKPGRTTQPLQSMLDNNFAFHSFDTLMKKTGYYDLIGGDSAYTILIPDNEAFTNSKVSIDSLLKLPVDSLKKFVGYHILKGSITTATIPQTITNPRVSVTGQTMYMSKPLSGASTTLHINGMSLNQVNLVATNGVVHVLKAPLRVPAATVKAWLLANPDQYSFFVAALKKFSLLDQLDKSGPYTVLAPDNSAFIKRNVTMDLINSDTFDIKHFNPFLFTAGILSGRIYSTDFGDAPVSGNGITYTRDGTVTFSSDYVGTLRATANNYILQDRYNYTQIGGYPKERMYEQQPAVNGVIHHMDDLLVYPNNVYIPQQ